MNPNKRRLLKIALRSNFLIDIGHIDILGRGKGLLQSRFNSHLNY
jgi:hypothetical protein